MASVRLSLGSQPERAGLELLVCPRWQVSHAQESELWVYHPDALRELGSHEQRPRLCGRHQRVQLDAAQRHRSDGNESGLDTRYLLLPDTQLELWNESRL